MTPAEALDQHRSLLAEDGEDVTVRRYAGTGASRAIASKAVARGRVIGAGAKPLVGEVVQAGRRVILVNDPLAALGSGFVSLASLLPLATATDRLFFRGAEFAIDDIDDDTRRVGGVLIALVIMVKG